MSDNLTPADRRRTMQAVRCKNTSLERMLFSMLAGMKIKGWKKNAASIPGKPDVVFDGQLAIFVDGCFWHACPSCKRSLPVTNREYWERKIRRNAQAAQEVENTLTHMGWKVVRVWEHDITDRKARAVIRRRIRTARKEALNRHGERH